MYFASPTSPPHVAVSADLIEKPLAVTCLPVPAGSTRLSNPLGKGIVVAGRSKLMSTLSLPFLGRPTHLTAHVENTTFVR